MYVFATFLEESTDSLGSFGTGPVFGYEQNALTTV